MDYVKIVKTLLSNIICKRWRIKEHGKCCYIAPRCKIVCKDARLTLGNNINILKDTLICCFPNSNVSIDDNTDIGQFSRIASCNKIVIGKNVITGPNIFIADYNHRYDNVKVPIKYQGNVCNGNSVIIDDNVWIGTNSVIIGNIHIGKGSVIGANSVVTSDVPAYSVAVGNPCRVIKKYNFKKEEWERIT